MPKPDHIGTCSNCAYYHPAEAMGHKGECHYHPPQVVQTGDADHPIIKSVWPAVSPDSWCGQWDDPAIVAIMVEEELAAAYATEADADAAEAAMNRRNGK